jgi:hypothetical protein
VKLIDKFLPPDTDPTLTQEQRELKEKERQHFVFAGILILGCMLMLPVTGVIYVLLIKFGVIASPF